MMSNYNGDGNRYEDWGTLNTSDRNVQKDSFQEMESKPKDSFLVLILT
jgi:hypothetical protein